MRKLTDEQKKEILSQLREPFDPEDIKWLPKIVSKDGKSAMALAYADPRAYIDRLNKVIGPDGWSKTFPVVREATGFSRYKHGWNAESEIPGQGTLFVVCRVEIFGLGVQEDVGECDLEDENCFTVASAQAFKRACVPFGLGRYLYDLPKNAWCPYDKKKKQFISVPSLPDWAVPKYVCEETGKILQPATIQGRYYTARQLAEKSLQKYGKVLCLEAMIERARKAKAEANKDQQSEKQPPTEAAASAA